MEPNQRRMRFKLPDSGTIPSGRQADPEAAGETQPLLPGDMSTGSSRAHDHRNDQPLFSCVSNPGNHLPVFTNIHRIRRDVTSVVEDYLSFEQLRDVRMNVAVVRPLVDKLYDLDDISIGMDPDPYRRHRH
jgi:hypothetical protein